MKVARQDKDNDEDFGAPSNAIKLKYDLKRLGCLKLSEAIIEKKDLQKEMLKSSSNSWTLGIMTTSPKWLFSTRNWTNVNHYLFLQMFRN